MSWKKIFTRDNLLILVLAGVLLLVIAIPTKEKDFSSGESQIKEGILFSGSFAAKEDNETGGQAVDRGYEKELEDRLTDILTQIEGVGQVKVMITLKSCEASENSLFGGISLSETYVPEIEGVLVVAEGAGRGNVNRTVTEIVCALFGIEAHKTMVVKMG